MRYSDWEQRQMDIKSGEEMDRRQAEVKTDTRTCTCYPGEGPLPCPRKFALRDCWRAAVLEETQTYITDLKGHDREPIEQARLNYLMRVRTCLEV